MALSSTHLLTGPACADFGGHTYWARDGIRVRLGTTLDPLDSDAHGPLDCTGASAPVEIEFTPSAPLVELVALYGLLALIPGDSLFGPVDTPLVLTAADGLRLTFPAAAVVRLPELILGAREPVAEPVRLLARPARGVGFAVPTRLIAIDNTTPPTPPRSLSPALAADFQITWQIGPPWEELRSRDGVTISCAMETAPTESAAHGLLDLTLVRQQATARFTPASARGPGESDTLAAFLRAGLARSGYGLGATAAALEIASENLRVILPAAQLTQADLDFAARRPRLGELTFTATRAQVRPLALAPLVAVDDGFTLTP